jgi:hypothetical protein
VCRRAGRRCARWRVASPKSATCGPECTHTRIRCEVHSSTSIGPGLDRLALQDTRPGARWQRYDACKREARLTEEVSPLCFGTLPSSDEQHGDVRHLARVGQVSGWDHMLVDNQKPAMATHGMMHRSQNRRRSRTRRPRSARRTCRGSSRSQTPYSRPWMTKRFRCSSPAERNLKGGVEIGDGGVTANEHATPDQRADPAQDNAQLVHQRVGARRRHRHCARR